MHRLITWLAQFGAILGQFPPNTHSSFKAILSDTVATIWCDFKGILTPVSKGFSTVLLRQFGAISTGYSHQFQSYSFGYCCDNSARFQRNTHASFEAIFTDIVTHNKARFQRDTRGSFSFSLYRAL